MSCLLKYQKNIGQIIRVGFFVVFFLIAVPHKQSLAADCALASSSATATFTLTNSCAFGESVDGVESGISVNNANLVIPDQKTLTVLDRSSNPSTLVVGELTVENGGSIIIPKNSGSQIIIGRYIWLKDCDNDTYTADTAGIPNKTKPATSESCLNYIRKDQYSLGISDCDDTDPTKNLSCTTDANLAQGSINRITNTSDPNNPALQDYYQEIGKDNGLVGLWHMNEAAGDAIDSSGNNNTGTSTNTTVIDGRISKARSFSGSNSYINAADSNSLDLTLTGTMETWIKIAANPGASAVVLNKGTFASLNAGTYALYLDTSGKIRAYIHNVTNSNTATSTNALTLNQWVHVAGTWDGSYLRVYINGNLEGYTAQTYTPAASTGALRFGGAADGGSLFTGSMDEIAIFNRALSPEELKLHASRRPWAAYTSSVLNLGSALTSTTFSWTWGGVGTRTYSSGTLTTDGGETPYSSVGLVAQWNLNNTSGTTATNNGGASSCGGTATNCDGTLTNFASTASQDQAVGTGWTNANKRWGAGALMFDGTNDYVSIPDRAVLDVGNAMSISLWANQRDLALNKTMIGRWTWQTDGVWLIQTDGIVNTQLRIFVPPTANDGGTVFARTPVGSWSTGWHHVAVTYDGTQSTNATKLKVYIDGIPQILTFDGTIPASLLNSASPIRIGDFGGLNRYWNGQIDAVQFYSRTLGVAEVLSLYNAGTMEMQWRAGSTTTPDSTEYAAGTNWTQWATVGTAAYETQLDAMDSTQASWYWDINSAGNADGTTAASMPKAKAQETAIKQEGTGSLKLSVGQPQVDANTVGLWHLDETSGTGAYIKDSSANANNGTPTGTTVIDGFFNKGRSFTGTTDKILSSSNIGITGAAARTLEFWLYPTRTTNECYLGYGSGTTANFFEVGSYYNNNWSFHCYACSWDTGIKIDTYLNKWSYHTITYDGTNVRWYINGSIIGTSPSLTLNTNTAPLYFGQAAHASTTYPFNGYMDEVKLSNVAKTADQIAEAYRAGRDHRLTRVISSTDATSNTKLPFWIASDRLGTFSELMVGESAFAEYEPDANTVGLWHFDEQSGSGAYLLDSSATANNGTPTSTVTSVSGKFGKGRYCNGTVNDTITMSANAAYNFGTADFTVSAWVNFLTEPTTYVNILSTINAANNTGWIMSTDSGGDMGFWLSGAATWTLTTVNVPVGWHYWTVARNSGTLLFYLDGVLRETAASKTMNVTASDPLKFCYNSSWTSNGIHMVDEPRIDTTARTAAQIRQAYERGLRTHPITIDFRAVLSETVGSSTTSFGIDETAYGSSQKANHIFSGDKLIVSENIDGTVYMVQGRVDTVNSSTGALTVTWDPGQTWPTNFTTNATVFKWQRELMDLTGIPIGAGTGDAINAKDALTRLTLRITDAYQGATIWLDDLRDGGPYLNTSPQTLTISPAKQYLQLRALFTSSNIATSSSLTTMTAGVIKPTLTPTPTPNAPTLLNSRSGKSCTTICTEIGKSCTSVGVNEAADSGTYMTNEACTTGVAVCSTVISTTAAGKCLNNAAPWVKCKCN